MSRLIIMVALAGALMAACGGDPPTGPTPGPRLSRTRFLAFGDSFTAGEVTVPSATAQAIGKLVLVPSASYPSVLQSRLHATYTNQVTTISVTNAGEPSERILDGLLRFPSVFDALRPDVLLIMEGANGLPQVGPDISAGVMRLMVQHAKAGNARVFVGSMIPQVAGRPRATTPVGELLAYNTTLQLMAQQEGVVFVDLYNPLLPDAPTVIGVDGLHPNEAGYRFIAQLFLEAIRRELETR